MTGIRPLIPLLAAAGVLLAANGLQGTLIALRASVEGFSTVHIGVMSAAYFIGYLAAAIFAPRLLQSVGHIRVFAAMASLSAIGTLLLAIVIDPLAWTAIRLMMGFCFAGLFTTMESWLNASAEQGNRARLLSVYRIIDLGAVTGAQYLIPIFGVEGYVIFSMTAILFAFSLVPVSLNDRSSPEAPDSFQFDLKAIWALSPLACMSCMSIGMTNSAFRLISPLHARDIGLDDAGVATFISAGIAGGVLLQYPLGWLSDRFNRRTAIALATSGAVLSGLFLSLIARTDPVLNMIGIFAFGAFALPIYSLSAAHANDRATDAQYVLVAAGLTFFFAVGAIVGPLAASVFMDMFGTSALFVYTSVIHGSLLAYTGLRALRGPPVTMRGRFVGLLRTSPVLYRLSRRDQAPED